MKLLESWDELEKKEDILKDQIKQLSEEKRKAFYQLQLKKLKDPDTYASVNWLFLGGFHHLYLRKYALFFIEFTLLILCIIGLFLGHSSAIFILLAISLYELPQLFFSQKIARQYNYQISCEIFNSIHNE